ncbi:kinesin motor protein, partial [Reticulomyxa filosa]
AYGQTGSGKTYTMEGPTHDRGVNYRAIKELFEVIEQRQENFTYNLKLSMIEIYNEKIQDLLVDRHAQMSMGDVFRAIKTGGTNRRVGVTNLNEHSSRSHSILSIEVIGDNHVTRDRFFGKLHLIDLAGSERTERFGAVGERMTEARNINRFLSALSNVIAAIRNKDPHVPYRNSKLTFLLQDSLGQANRNTVIANEGYANGGESLSGSTTASQQEKLRSEFTENDDTSKHYTYRKRNDKPNILT